jgi:hypothetical protein
MFYGFGDPRGHKEREPGLDLEKGRLKFPDVKRYTYRYRVDIFSYTQICLGV